MAVRFFCMLKRIDFYIIKKFLGTYVLSIVLVISIAIVIDITEKMDDFYREGLDMKTIIFDYYIYFIPYYINLFSSLFTFLSVIFVTSKLAYNTEIIAMLAGGISYKRILLPYMLSAAIIASATYYISAEVIPPGIRERLRFESEYIYHETFEESTNHKQLQLSANEVIYVERFNLKQNIGYRFSYDQFDGKRLVKRITGLRIEYNEKDTEKMRADSTLAADMYCWDVKQYVRREFQELREQVKTGSTLQLQLAMAPSDFVKVLKEYEQFTTRQLRQYIDTQSQRGVGGLNAYKLELYKRYANPFGAFILTLIGVSIASKKVRGGTGYHIFMGLLLSVTYILFNLTSVSFTTKGGIHPLVAVWFPNVLYFCIGLYLYKKAPK